MTTKKHHTHHEAVKAAHDAAWHNGHTLDPFQYRNGVRRAYCFDCSKAAIVAPDDDGLYHCSGRAVSTKCAPLF